MINTSKLKILFKWSIVWPLNNKIHSICTFWDIIWAMKIGTIFLRHQRTNFEAEHWTRCKANTVEQFWKKVLSFDQTKLFLDVFFAFNMMPSTVCLYKIEFLSYGLFYFKKKCWTIALNKKVKVSGFSQQINENTLIFNAESNAVNRLSLSCLILSQLSIYF